MPLPRRSPTSDIPRLIDDLGADEDARRDAAIARLAVIGDRAVARLVETATDDGQHSRRRVGALVVLERLSERRGQAAALGLTESADTAVAVAASAVLGGALHGDGRLATQALDRLTGLALDAAVAVERRLAALEALEGLLARQLRTIHEALARDPASRVVARVTRRQAGVLAPLDELVDTGFPDDPALVAAIVREDAPAAKITVIRRAIDAIRKRERHTADVDAARWIAVRGQLHEELASRSSRIALYDLKETLEVAAVPLPGGFLSAAAAIGDVECLEPIARAWVAGAESPPWWRDHLADAFQTIVRRDALAREHPALVRILKQLPAAGMLVGIAPKTISRTSRTRP